MGINRASAVMALQTLAWTLDGALTRSPYHLVPQWPTTPWPPLSRTLGSTGFGIYCPSQLRLDIVKHLYLCIHEPLLHH